MQLADIDYRRNSIGFLRLFFAALVIFSHGYGLGGFNPADEIAVKLSGGQWSLGSLAVCSFFFLSGFLVTKSYDGLQSLAHFIWHRVLRIFPGFWCCLIVTAFVFAPLLYFFEHRSLTGFLNLSAGDNALGFLTHNYTLDMYQFDVLGVTKVNPYNRGLNGSLWTLGNEFRCYMVVALLGVTGILMRSRAVVLAILAALWAISVSPALGTSLILKHPVIFGIFEQSFQFEEMFVYFFLGAAAYLYRAHIPIRAVPFAIAAVGVFAVLPWPWFRAVMPLLLGYSIVWLMCKLPIRSIDRHVDLSYGVYIYAFPIQQTLTFFGLNRLGFGPYTALCIAGTAPLAAASWFLVESQALRWKNSSIPAHAASLFDRYAGRPITAATRKPLASIRRSLEPVARQLTAWRIALQLTAWRSALTRRLPVRALFVLAAGAVAVAASATAWRVSAAPHRPLPATTPVTAQRFVPDGITPEGDLSVETNGIFTAASRAECCWLSPVAAFRTAAPSTAERSGHMILHVYVPDLPYLRLHPPRLRARVTGGGTAEQDDLTPGSHTLAVRMNAGSAGPIDVRVDSGPPWSGADSGINGDRRTVTVMLQAVSFR